MRLPKAEVGSTRTAITGGTITRVIAEDGVEEDVWEYDTGEVIHQRDCGRCDGGLVYSPVRFCGYCQGRGLVEVRQP